MSDHTAAVSTFPCLYPLCRPAGTAPRRKRGIGQRHVGEGCRISSFCYRLPGNNPNSVCRVITADAMNPENTSDADIKASRAALAKRSWRIKSLSPV